MTNKHFQIRHNFAIAYEKFNFSNTKRTQKKINEKLILENRTLEFY